MNTKNVMAFVIIVAAVLIGVTFIMSSSASAAIVTPGTGIVRPAINSSFIAPGIAQSSFIAPRPFVRPFGFFPRVNPFLFDVDVDPFFFDVDVDPFFFNEGIGFEGFAAD